VTLQMARRVKTAIESRLGLRVLLTRDGDDEVTLDRRTELANNNKADLFVSFHANWSTQPAAHGAQIYSLGIESYREQMAAAESQKRTVPTVGGGVRVLEPVPWDMAQLPFADESAAVAASIVRFFGEKNIPLFVKPSVQAPMRVLMGANMPAVLIELGFMSNADDEKAITDARADGVKATTSLKDAQAALNKAIQAHPECQGIKLFKLTALADSHGIANWDAEFAADPGVTISPDCKRVLIGAKQAVQKHFDLAGGA